MPEKNCRPHKCVGWLVMWSARSLSIRNSNEKKNKLSLIFFLFWTPPPPRKMFEICHSLQYELESSDKCGILTNWQPLSKYCGAKYIYYIIMLKPLIGNCFTDVRESGNNLFPVVLNLKMSIILYYCCEIVGHDVCVKCERVRAHVWKLRGSWLGTEYLYHVVLLNLVLL